MASAASLTFAAQRAQWEEEVPAAGGLLGQFQKPPPSRGESKRRMTCRDSSSNTKGNYFYLI